MPEEPPNINSTGDQPTNLGDGANELKGNPRRERDASQPEPGARSGAPEGFQIPASDGDLDTYDAEQQLGQFVESGSELPPELVEEQRAVLLKPGDVVADRFEVVKQLGFGGMGAVYHVKDRYTRQDRALKVMLPSLLKSPAARERFRSEVTISQKLSHENIVRVHDLAADQKRKFYYFTMELVEGRTLNRLLKERGGKLPLDEALDIVRQLCDALEYAHKHTIHRDLKPQNIMIRPDGSIKVLDFGLAKLMSPGRMTRSSMALGTAYYQAPEQSIHLSELDQRADIYSIGVMFYQMLTGEIPAGRFESLARVIRGIPKPLSDLVDRCLDPKPEGRPESAGELRQAIDQAAKKGRSKWAVPAMIAGVFTVAVIGAVFMKLGTVPSERSETGLSPISSSESRESPDGTMQHPISEPSPPAPEPPRTPEESSATASEASTARQAAVAAQQAAQKAGAQEHALELWDEAVKALKQAEAHDTLEAFDDAIGGYEEAEKAFTEAETEATRSVGEIEALNKAKTAMETAKSEAETLDAAQHAKVRYEQAVKAEEEAAGIDNDRVGAAQAYEKAAQRYQLAVDETKQQGTAIVAAAKKGAETAKEQANTADVKKYSAKELEAAQALFDQAANASDFQKAKGLYEQAAEKFASAVEEAAKRKEIEAMEVGIVDKSAYTQVAVNSENVERLIRSAYEDCTQGNTVESLVSLYLKLRNIVEQTRSANMNFWDGTSAPEYAKAVSHFLYDEEAGKELGLNVERHTGLLALDETLLRRAHLLDPDSGLAEFTLFGILERRKGRIGGGYEMPNLDVGREYLRRFPNGPFVEDVLFRIGMMYQDIYELSDLYDGRYGDAPFKDYNSALGELMDRPTAKESKEEAIWCFQELGRRFPESSRFESAQRYLEHIRNNEPLGLLYWWD